MCATVADVARKVGKSQQLVSAVLNGGRSKSAASKKTRDLIEKAAEKLGYRPNSAARAVSTGRFNAVGLLLSTSTWKSNITGTMLNGINRSLAADDMHLMVSGFPDETLTDDTRLPKVLRHMLVDGLIVKYDCQMPPRMVELIRDCGLPIVWMNSKHEFDCVHPADFDAAERATQHLLALGHTRIAFADFSPRPVWDHYSNSDRLAGYSRAMKSAGYAPCRLNDTQASVPLNDRIACATGFLSQKSNAPNAVVAAGTGDALPVIYAAALLGLRVPEDISVIVFEGQPVNSMGLKVSTMLIPEEQMGFASAEMLRKRIAISRTARISPVEVPFGFEPGETCAPPRPAAKIRRHSRKSS